MSRNIRRTRGLAAVALVALVAGGLAATSGSVGAAPGSDEGGDQVKKQLTDKAQVVFVRAPTVAQRNKVVRLGLDLTEHATTKGIEVVLYGDQDEKTLRKAGFSWDVKVDDLGEASDKQRRADRRYAARVAESPLPSGQNAYRGYQDYVSDMNKLAKKYPSMTKPLTLKHKTVLGEPIRGLEISVEADRVKDGKPVFLLMGAHHAREWPSSEHTIEFAYSLLQDYTLKKARARSILKNERVIVVPVVNVDGFKVSREAAPLGNFSALDYEMKRKNCAISNSTPAESLGGTCSENPAGRLRGTDINRNYPGFWGGAGASPVWSSDTFRGDNPGDSPESKAVRALISERAVTMMISNHTYSNLILRPPAIQATGNAPDEVAYKELADSMAQSNDYASQASYQLYDTSGSTEDWSYWNTGGFGFTFEIGPDGFHPEFQDAVVGEYLGVKPAAGAGKGGNREAYYRAAEAAMNPRLHSRITGSAPKGYTLQVRKRFISQTSDVIDLEGNPGQPRYYQDTLTTAYKSKGGAFNFRVNPSTRPVVVGRYGREPEADPQAQIELTNPATVPPVGGTEEVTFEIKGLPEVDNGLATLNFSWPGGADWDYVILDPSGQPVGSAETLSNPEVATIPDPVPGLYTVRATNYGAGSAEDDWTGTVNFEGPEPGTYSGLKESWTLTCTNKQGKTVRTSEVVVDRGKAKYVKRPCGKAKRKGKGKR